MKIYIYFGLIFGSAYTISKIILEANDNINNSILGLGIGVLISLLMIDYEDYRYYKKQYSKKKVLLKQELYNNFIISITRIAKIDSNLKFSTQYYETFFELVSQIRKGKFSRFIIKNSNFSDDIINLYFIFYNGDKMFKKYEDFYNQKFNIINVNPKSFDEILEQIGFGNIQNVFEFITIKLIYKVNIDHNLEIELPIHKYEVYINSINIPHKIDLVKYYISEQVAKSIFSINSESFIDTFIVDKGPKKEEKSTTLDFNKHLQDFKDEVITELASTNSYTFDINKFLNEGIYSGKYFNSVIESLKNICNNIPMSSLAFLGILVNNDTIDNNSYNRKSNFNGDSKPHYDLANKSWWKEAHKAKGDFVISSPYKDSSDASVYSVVKAFYGKDKKVPIGVVGVDIPIDTLYMKTSIVGHTLLVNKSGGIIFDSNPSIKQIIENQPNIKLIMGYEDFNNIYEENINNFDVAYYEDKYKLSYKIINNKEYLISLDENTIKEKTPTTNRKDNL